MPLHSTGQAAAGFDVVLIKPSSGAFSSFPPLNLMMLAASLRQTGRSVRVLDLCHEEDVAELAAIGPDASPSLFGVTATTPEFLSAARLVGDLKQRFPGVPTVIGGVHMSALGADALAESGADYGVVGEGEIPIRELVDALSGDQARVRRISGLFWREGLEITGNPPDPDLPDVDSLPPPDWDTVNSERYFSRPWGILQERSRTGFIVTSRGCSCACGSCASSCTTGGRFRGRDPRLVVDEMEDLCRRHGIREFLIAEDNFTRDHARAEAICGEIIRRGLDISWRTPNGVPPETLDRSLVALMRRSGCYLTGFSTECSNSADAGAAGREALFHTIASGISMCRSAGMVTFCSFILGRPDETVESARAMTRFAMRSGVDIAHFGAWAPYPGSTEFERLRNEPGMRDWDRYLLFDALPVSGLPPRQVKSIMRRAYLSFYFRPSRAGLYLKMLRPAQIAWALRAFGTYVR